MHASAPGPRLDPSNLQRSHHPHLIQVNVVRRSAPTPLRRLVWLATGTAGPAQCSERPCQTNAPPSNKPLAFILFGGSYRTTKNAELPCRHFVRQVSSNWGRIAKISNHEKCDYSQWQINSCTLPAKKAPSPPLLGGGERLWRARRNKRLTGWDNFSQTRMCLSFHGIC